MANEHFFQVQAKDPAMQAVLQKIVDQVSDSDEFRDMARIPRKGREPDYLYGRWCIRCHNSLPDDWGIKPCDVCGADTGSRTFRCGSGEMGTLYWSNPPGDPEKFPE